MPILSDETPIEDVELPPRLRNALSEAGYETVGEVKQASDGTLLSLQNFGHRSLRLLRAVLGSGKT
jgi:DNA-directed RNA polymerase alpha subunit